MAQLENSTVLVARYNVGQDNTGVIGVIARCGWTIPS